jgi:hypothetical protein
MFFSKNEFDEPFTYNSSNIVFKDGLEIERQNEDGTIQYEYDKDEIGNWIRRKSVGSRPEFISTREIYYKGDDISSFYTIYDNIKNEVISKITSTKEKNNVTINNNENSNQLLILDNNESNKNTDTRLEKRKCSSCNGTGQCPKCSKPQRVRYKQGESPNDHNEIRQGMIVCTQCGGNLMNFGADKNKSCYLCKASGWLYCSECNSNGNGSYLGKCQRCKGAGFDR